MLKLNAVDGITLCTINALCVNLRCGDVGMVEHLAYRIYVSPGGELESGECVAETVECYAFCDTSCFQSFLQRLLSHRAVESLEYNPLVTFTAQCQHLRTERVDRFFLCLLNTDEHSHLAIGIRAYVLPP